MMVLLVAIERLLAWHSIEKFKITEYYQKIDLNSGDYNVGNFNLAAVDFDVIVGLDMPL